MYTYRLGSVIQGWGRGSYANQQMSARRTGAGGGCGGWWVNAPAAARARQTSRGENSESKEDAFAVEGRVEVLKDHGGVEGGQEEAEDEGQIPGSFFTPKNRFIIPRKALSSRPQVPCRKSPACTEFQTVLIGLLHCPFSRSTRT